MKKIENQNKNKKYDQKKCKSAVASFILSLVGFVFLIAPVLTGIGEWSELCILIAFLLMCIAPFMILISFILGIISLGNIKKNGFKGKFFAWFGIIFSFLLIVLIIFLAVTGIMSF